MAEKLVNNSEGTDEKEILEDIFQKFADDVEVIENGDFDKSMVLAEDTASTQVLKDFIDLEEEKKRILRIIKKIHGQRNKAGYQRILAFAQRENKNLIMADVKIIVRDLLLNDLIYDASNVINDESFKLREMTEPVSPPSCVPMTKNISSTKKDNEKKHGEDKHQDDALQDLTKFIDESFHEILFKRIKNEVTNCVKTELSKLKIPNELKVVNRNLSKDYEDTTIIKSLRDEIKLLKAELLLTRNASEEKSSNELLLNNELFEEIALLKKEISSKNEIIKILASDRHCLETANKGIPKNIISNTVNDNESSDDDSDEVNDRVLRDADKRTQPEDITTNSNLRGADKGNGFKLVSKKKSGKRNITIPSDSTVKSIGAH